MTTHAGTGLFCRVRFISLFLRDVFFRAAIYDPSVHFFRFLSVGVTPQGGATKLQKIAEQED
jgi:hypothetical protein